VATACLPSFLLLPQVSKVAEQQVWTGVWATQIPDKQHTNVTKQRDRFEQIFIESRRAYIA
jgi:hypothetical protein